MILQIRFYLNFVVSECITYKIVTRMQELIENENKRYRLLLCTTLMKDNFYLKLCKMSVKQESVSRKQYND